MNDVDIACFLSCVQTRSFSIAARNLSMSHQAVSKHIQNLENEVGYPLLLRNWRSVQVTPAGKFFYDWLFELDQKLAYANYHLRTGGGDSCLCLGVLDWLGIPAEVQAALNALQHEMRIELYVMTLEEAQHALLEERTDLIICPSQLMGMNLPLDTTTAPLCKSVSFRLACGRQLLSPDGRLDFEMLLNRPFLSYDCGEQMNAMLNELCAEFCHVWRQPVPEKMCIGNFNSVLSEVALGNGFSFVPECMLPYYALQQYASFLPLEGLEEKELPLMCMWRMRPGREQVLRLVEEVCSL